MISNHARDLPAHTTFPSVALSAEGWCRQSYEGRTLVRITNPRRIKSALLGSSRRFAVTSLWFVGAVAQRGSSLRVRGISRIAGRMAYSAQCKGEVAASCSLVDVIGQSGQKNQAVSMRFPERLIPNVGFMALGASEAEGDGGLEPLNAESCNRNFLSAGCPVSPCDQLIVFSVEELLPEFPKDGGLNHTIRKQLPDRWLCNDSSTGDCLRSQYECGEKMATDLRSSKCGVLGKDESQIISIFPNGVRPEMIHSFRFPMVVNRMRTLETSRSVSEFWQRSFVSMRKLLANEFHFSRASCSAQ